MWILTLLFVSAIGFSSSSSLESPSKRAHTLCFQCFQIDLPENCKFITSKCHQCRTVKHGSFYELGCGDKHCQPPECCSENLCNGETAGPVTTETPGTGTTQSPGTPAIGDCPPGRYGANCVNFCSGNCNLGSLCDAVDGSCPELNGLRCIPGYLGDRCDQACGDGLHGDFCQHSCSEHCYNSSICDNEIGHCPISGPGIPRCSSGWQGADCQLDCERGRWGEDCMFVCSPHCWDFSPCDGVNGLCEKFDEKPQCASGWTGSRCERICPRGTFGEDCVQNCSGNCNHGAACDPVTGFCLVTGQDPRCAPGWRGETCQLACPTGRYGNDCEQICSGHCHSGRTCDTVTGFCPLVLDNPRCEDGWSGASCDAACGTDPGEECVHKCTDNCLNGCDPDTGTCGLNGLNQRCAAGWVGEKCDSPCLPGSHGVDCQTTCTGNCYHGASCDPVLATCPQHTGRARCDAGWQGEKCDQQCALHTYGPDCSSLCFGSCYNHSSCVATDGSCPIVRGQHRCAAGWQDQFCDQRCLAGRYGEDCLRVCGNCVNGTACSGITGECSFPLSGSRCEPGYFGEQCKWACNPGTYGGDCTQHCSGHCNQGASCEPVTGNCPKVNGVRMCEDGFEGDKCDVVTSATPAH